MSFHAYTVYEIECDKCGLFERHDHYAGYPIHLEKKSLRSDGWKIGKYITCPNCAKQPPNEDQKNEKV